MNLILCFKETNFTVYTAHLLQYAVLYTLSCIVGNTFYSVQQINTPLCIIPKGCKKQNILRIFGYIFSNHISTSIKK